MRASVQSPRMADGSIASCATGHTTRGYTGVGGVRWPFATTAGIPGFEGRDGSIRFQGMNALLSPESEAVADTASILPSGQSMSISRS